jgi:hypothetical protein
VHRVNPAPTVARTSHAVKRTLPSAQGVAARATRSVKAATAHLSTAKRVLPVVLGTVAALPRPVVVGLPPVGGEPILLVPSSSDQSPAMTGISAIAGTQASAATTAHLPTTPSRLDHRVARAMLTTVDGLVDQLTATGSPSPLALSALVTLALGAATAASGSLSSAASGGTGSALVPAPQRSDTGGLVRRYGVPSRQTPFRTPPRPGFFPA